MFAVVLVLTSLLVFEFVVDDVGFVVRGVCVC